MIKNKNLIKKPKVIVFMTTNKKIKVVYTPNKKIVLPVVSKEATE